MEIGVIKWFNNSKGFGVADTVQGQVFVHIKSFRIKPTNLSPRDAVLVKIKEDTKNRHAVAGQSRLIGEAQDWGLIVSLALDQDGKGNIITKGSHLPIPELAAYQYLNGKSREQIFEDITSYFLRSLSDEKFIPYGEFVEKVFTRSMGVEKRNELLTRIFTFFGQHVNERKLFLIWNSKKFRYIGHLEADDFEIPADILKLFASELNKSDLQRIRTYSYSALVLDELHANESNVK